ncbi:D-alanine--D-alanine ligase [Paraburkholderia denitrificans]|uniref:D-alanine--D-alanine ligase n=1 Tax=Paraburkholderia denitrificans TaxID=694025 RepID=A0ABW0J6Y1_9BURK
MNHDDDHIGLQKTFSTSTMPLKIAMLCGGTSEEREVSLASAAMVVPALRGLGHSVRVLDLGRGLLVEDSSEERRALSAPPAHHECQEHAISALMACRPSVLELTRSFDLVFIALHGGTGEDGTVQATLDLIGIPYTGSGHVASGVCMDKDLTKHLLRAADITTPDWCLLTTDSAIYPGDCRYPVVVKPNRQGSTVGLSIVRHPNKLEAAIQHAFRFDSEVLIEQFIAGREFTVGVLDNEPLVVGEILIQADSAFGYEEKYTPGAIKEQFPARIGSELTEQMKDVAQAAHRLLKLRGYSRADFRVDSAGKVWLLEVNSLPGLTGTSLFPQSARAHGIEFPQLCGMICQLAMRHGHHDREA